MAGHEIDEADVRRRKTRGRARLKALGIDVDQMTHEQVRQIWETTRQAYINNAQAGLHLEPMRLDGDPLPGACLASRFGVFRDALKDFYGEHPAGWSPAQIQWPGPRESASTVTVTQDHDEPRSLPPAT